MKLSIIIPIHNVEKYISNTIDSLLNQTVLDFEIILVNDGSTDNSALIAENILSCSQFKDYKYIIKENGGVSSARNRGIIESTGNYILFLDGDDYVESHLVEIIYNNIQNCNPEIVCWGFNIVDENRKVLFNYLDTYILKQNNFTGIDALENILIKKSLWIWTCSAVYKKDFLLSNNLRYTDYCINGEDQEFTYKALSNAKSVIFINKVLSYYVQRSSSITNTYNIKKFDAVNAIIRASDYIQNKGLSSNNVITHLKTNCIIDNYFYNFNSCLYVLMYKIDTYNKKIIEVLIDDINKSYPDMNGYIRNLLKNIKNITFKEKLKYKLFLISPLLYYWLFVFKLTRRKL